MKCKRKQSTAEEGNKSIDWSSKEEKSSNKKNADEEGDEEQSRHKETR